VAFQSRFAEALTIRTLLVRATFMTHRPGAVGVLSLLAAWALLVIQVHGQHAGHGSPNTANTADGPISVTSTLPAKPQAGRTYNFTLAFANASATPASISASDLIPDHTKVLHAVFVGGDLDSFYHVHPEEFGYREVSSRGSSSGTELPLAVRFPFAGAYVASFDAQTKRSPLATTSHWRVAGAPALRAAAVANQTNVREVQAFRRASAAGPLPWVSLAQLQGETQAGTPAMPPRKLLTSVKYIVKFTRPARIVAGQAFSFTIAVSHAANGSPVTDLTPLWGAQAHIAVVKHDLSYMEHAHAMGAMAANTSSTGMGGMAGMGGMSGMSGAGSTSMGGMETAVGPFGPQTGGELTLPDGKFRLVFQMTRGSDFVFVPFDLTVSAGKNAQQTGGTPAAPASQKSAAPSPAVVPTAASTSGSINTCVGVCLLLLLGLLIAW
jgi:hypothetical protein